MNDEKWIQWKPINNLAPKYYIDSVREGQENLKIILSEDTNKFNKALIFFSKSVEAFRSTEESFTLSTLYFLDEKYGSKFYNWTFFKVENSGYIEWITKQTCTSKYNNYTHYCIFAVDFMLDIISNHEPVVTVFKEESIII